MATWFWNGGDANWDTPNYWIGPEDFSTGTFPSGNPAPGDTAVVYSGVTIDSLSLTNTIDAGISSTVQDSIVIQTSTFDVGNTLNVMIGQPANSGFSADIFGGLTNSGSIAVGSGATTGHADFEFVQAGSYTSSPVFLNDGTINVSNGEFQLGESGTIPVSGEFDNEGDIIIGNTGSGSSYLLDNLTNGSVGFLNDGTITINGGASGTALNTYAWFTGLVSGPVSGSGVIDLTSGGVYVEPASPAAFSSSETIVFEDGKGVVALGSGELASGLFQAHMEDFQTGDTIDLGVLATSAIPNGVGVVSIFNGGSLIGTLNVTEAFGLDSYTLTPKGSTDTLLVVGSGGGGSPQLAGSLVAIAPIEGTALPATTKLASFTDTTTSDVASDFSASINWGDGTVTTGTVTGSAGSFAVDGGHTYAGEGSDPLSITVTDTLNNGTLALSGSVTVAEGDTLTPHAVTFAATAGTAFTGTVATFSDTDTATPASDFTATINWGDGTSNTGTVAGSAGSFTVSGTHTYTSANTDTVSVTLKDNSPGTATATATSTANVTSAAPQLAGSLVAIAPIEDTALPATTKLASFTDTTTSDVASDFSASINWGDGTVTTGTVTGSAGSFAVDGGHTYAGEGSDPLSITVTDTLNNGTLALSGSVTVAEGDTLTPHAVTFAATAGTAFTGTVATFSDTDTATPASDFTATINWGDGTSNTGTVAGSAGSFTVSGTHTYTSANTDTVSVTLKDNSPGTATATATSTANVTSAAPQLAGSLVAIAPIEDTALPATTKLASFTDTTTSDVASDFSASINWGDGTVTTGTVTGSAGSFAVDGGHTYAGEGSDPLSITVTDTLNNGTLALSGSVTVAEGDTLTPHAVTFAATAGTAFTGTVATFSDTDTATPGSDFTATINWGDGTSNTGTVAGSAGSFTVSGTHTYTSANTDTVSVTLKDNSPGTATATASSTANVTSSSSGAAPTISGTRSGQTTVDYVPIKPFAAVTITNTVAGVDSLTIVLKNGGGSATDANGVLSGGGLTKTGVGTYTLAAATPATLTSELEALSFVPTQGEVAAGKTETTSFTLTASETEGSSTVATTNSTTSVVVTALDYVTGPAGGFGVLTGNGGQDVITAHGYFNLINGGGGADFINAGSGLAYVNVGDGSATVTLGGELNVVTGTNGTVTVTGASGGLSAVTLGNGNDVVTIGGKNDEIRLGNGNDLVSGTQGMAFITTGSGNDTITVAGTGNTVNAGGGTNVIHGGTGADTFVLPPAGLGFDTITGFSELNGDVLDLRNALADTSWNGRSATLGNYLKVTSGGGNTTLAIASHGTGSGTAIATLSGSGNLGLPDLLSHHSLLT